MKLRHAMLLAVLSTSSVVTFAASKHQNHDASQETTEQATIVNTQDATTAQPASNDAPASAETATPVAQ